MVVKWLSELQEKIDWPEAAPVVGRHQLKSNRPSVEFTLFYTVHEEHESTR